MAFNLPATPAGCTLESAKLRLYSPSASEGFRLEALRIAEAWGEGSVTWDTQPATDGLPRATWTAEGVVSFNVTSQVLAGAAHGFLLKAAEEDAEAGVGVDFHGREKGETPPEVALRFVKTVDGPPPPPAPPVAATVRCGRSSRAARAARRPQPTVRRGW